jgi:hypothetical protein
MKTTAAKTTPVKAIKPKMTVEQSVIEIHVNLCNYAQRVLQRCEKLVFIFVFLLAAL